MDPPVKLVVEVQASYVGCGKSTFTQDHLSYPRVDDCVNMIESYPDFFANATDLAAHLVIENYAATLDVVASQCEPSWTIVASRSPLISAVQFSNETLDWKALERYYRKRLEHLGVDQVLILDYGTSIQQNGNHVKRAFEQMKKRGRLFELERYVTQEAYQKFFHEGENRKREVIPLLNPLFYTYKAMDFNGFGKLDAEMANKAIQDCQSKILENKQMQRIGDSRIEDSLYFGTGPRMKKEIWSDLNLGRPPLLLRTSLLELEKARPMRDSVSDTEDKPWIYNGRWIKYTGC